MAELQLHPSIIATQNRIKFEKIAALGLHPTCPIESLDQYNQVYLENSTKHLITKLDAPFTGFKSSDLIETHAKSFKNIHPWAGETHKRNDMSFGGFQGAPYQRHALELAVLDAQANELLSSAKSPSDKLQAISFYHSKAIAIHPFLDGNGRVTRTELMSQAFHLLGVNPLQIMTGIANDKAGYVNAMNRSRQQDDPDILGKHLAAICDIPYTPSKKCPYKTRISTSDAPLPATQENIKIELQKQRLSNELFR